MLCSANSGKYLSRRYETERAKAVEDKTLFTDAELSFLEITGVEGTGVHQEETFLIDKMPIDSTVLKEARDEHEAIDIRKFPQMGGDLLGKDRSKGVSE